MADNENVKVANDTVVKFKTKEEVNKEKQKTPQELFDIFMDKSKSEKILICGYDEKNNIAFGTNMINVPMVNYVIDTVKKQILG